MSVVDAFARDFAATMASDAYSNSTHALLPFGLFAMLNQVATHLLVEQLVHGRRACFAPKPDWAYAPEPAFEREHACAGARCYIDRDLGARRPARRRRTRARAAAAAAAAATAPRP